MSRYGALTLKSLFVVCVLGACFACKLLFGSPITYSEIVIDTYDPVNPNTTPIAPVSFNMQLWSSDGKTLLASDVGGASRPVSWPYRFGPYIDYKGGITSGDYWVLVLGQNPPDSAQYAVRVIETPSSDYSTWGFASYVTETASDQPLVGGGGIPTKYQTMYLNNPSGSPTSSGSMVPNHLNRSFVPGGVNWIKIHLP